jgi:hypothetical protein
MGLNSDLKEQGSSHSLSGYVAEFTWSEENHDTSGRVNGLCAEIRPQDVLNTNYEC